MYAVVGLGNPGRKYQRTRHNLGFRVVDHLARKWDISFSRGHELFENCVVKRDATSVMLVKPMTFMNRSGEAVREIVTRYAIKPADLLVLVDDFALPIGRLRLRGSDGGHNGLASIIQSLDSSEFARLRMGIGLDPSANVINYVLSPFRKDERAGIEEMIEYASEAVVDWMDRGIQVAMNKYNSKQ